MTIVGILSVLNWRGLSIFLSVRQTSIARLLEGEPLTVNISTTSATTRNTERPSLAQTVTTLDQSRPSITLSLKCSPLKLGQGILEWVMRTVVRRCRSHGLEPFALRSFLLHSQLLCSERLGRVRELFRRDWLRQYEAR